MDYTNEYLKEVLTLRYDKLSRQSLKRIEELEEENKGLKKAIKKAVKDIRTVDGIGLDNIVLGLIKAIANKALKGE